MASKHTLEDRNFAKFRANVANRVNARLDTITKKSAVGPLFEPICQALHGGKRVRALLVIESARIHSADKRQAEYAAAAIECLHAYSLVHDDLPCMDDDQLRRGQPTIHVAWNEAVAVLTGDALQSLAFEVLSDGSYIPDSRTRVRLINRLARRAGSRGMAAGQAMDLAAEGSPSSVTMDDLSKIHRNKTGNLIEWSAEAGAILANQDADRIRQFARAIGLGYQIVDDLLDATGNTARTGKAVGKDLVSGKATFVTLLGEERARLRAHEQLEAAMAALDEYGSEADMLRRTARFAMLRDY
ncbi:MAG: polyprenyl synthetase family protein [Rhodobacteraceae bacterium]|nr:polyprenyl synthetase family protein [Paracoccaceae bacterium]